jgi:arylsulfatase
MARVMARLGGVFELSALGLLLTASAAAQALPDFSGRWIAVPEPAATGGGNLAAGPLGSGWGNEVTLTQDATTLTVERAQFSAYDMQPPMRFTYALDGSENRMTLNVGRGPQEMVAKTSRQDASLVITTSYRVSLPDDGRPATVEVKQLLSLDTAGSLVVTTTLTGLKGGISSTSTTRYKKA